MAQRIFPPFAGLILCLTLTSLAFPAGADSDSVFGYSLERDVVYGQGIIAPEGKEISRDLMLDIYTPTEASTKPFPAVIYVHGGAFHRGGRRNPPYKDKGSIHSSPEDWARLLAANGYKVFVIEYRLAPQNPIPRLKPGEDHVIADIKIIVPEEFLVGFSRARTAMGLTPLDYNDESLKLAYNVYASSVEDAKLALDYVVAHAKELNIDPDRIAMGGHSAGAGITASVGLGLKTPLKAIFPQSPPDILFDKDYVAGRTDLPAVMLHCSQFDDVPILGYAPELVKLLSRADTEFTFCWIPAFGHFYPYNAPSLGDNGTLMPLGDRIVQFLDKHLKD